MSFTSTLFLFVFLPVALSFYYFSKDSFKEYLLFGFSLIFYSLGSTHFLVIFLGSITATVLIGRTMQAIEKSKIKTLLLVFGIVINTGILFYYKYSNFAITTFSQLTGNELEIRELLLPLGISFYTFKAISYLADVYTEKSVLGDEIIHDFLYLSIFSQIQSGPITRYSNFKKLDCDFKDSFSNGAIRFMLGFNKKVLIANVLANITKEVFNTPVNDCSTGFLWLGSICYSLQLFFDFAGYSDMAIGLTEMFGYSCMENFKYPYMTESVSKFWRRWHISLSEWFRDYIYIPLGGSRNKHKILVYFNLFVVWVLTGIWHGAAWNFIWWGLGYFVLISFERLTGLPERFSTILGKVLYRIFTLLFINFQWVMFNSKDINTGLDFIKHMIVYQNNELANLRAIFLLKDYLFFILIAIVFCFPVVPWVKNTLVEKEVASKTFDILENTIIFISFLWAISFIIAGQNNPFAYANF
ncbi:MBOAT family O-acyltransferase [Pseudobutyrivibrio xylanivorans]|uniref:Alginate O-acetyltransferase complex protein AlgI n=1 Tax=Pseudobutyrivibrio xylanivorans TaxID=185007 RepID=A0A1G5S4G1_PSEXY|nr:MBOAT family O-acyltransferase [Pseudobutyrivibrio xylanivorans]SCZ81255.1 alginate O-acetyltransferase complex protein AlgI [Pseudobutyrivibrio xylanivorans]